MSTTEELKHKFWTALADSPFVFLQKDGDSSTAVPMTAQLDKDAHGAIWFFTSKDHALARATEVTATFSAKDNQLFARFTGTLLPETSRERLDKHWSKMMDAWFPGGKDDPDLLMLRMNLRHAEIWNSDLGLVDNARMFMGFDVRDEARKEHAETVL